MTPDERFERIEETLAAIDVRLDRAVKQGEQTDARLDRAVEQGERTDARLDRAIRLSVREARSERNKRRELDEKMTQLAAAQVVTEEKLQGLIEALKRGGNGHG